MLYLPARNKEAMQRTAWPVVLILLQTWLVVVVTTTMLLWTGLRAIAPRRGVLNLWTAIAAARWPDWCLLRGRAIGRLGRPIVGTTGGTVVVSLLLRRPVVVPVRLNRTVKGTRLIASDLSCGPA